jgi:hypothetical protein
MVGRALNSLALGCVLFGLLATTAATSEAPGAELSYLTFNRPIALPGVELAAGTYRFELALPLSDQNVVRVSSYDRKKTYLTVFTYAVPRPPKMRRDSYVTFGESHNGAPTPITAWFPEGAEIGRQFIYR